LSRLIRHSPLELYFKPDSSVSSCSCVLNVNPKKLFLLAKGWHSKDWKDNDSLRMEIFWTPSVRIQVMTFPRPTRGGCLWAVPSSQRRRLRWTRSLVGHKRASPNSRLTPFTKMEKGLVKGDEMLFVHSAEFGSHMIHKSNFQIFFSLQNFLRTRTYELPNLPFDSSAFQLRLWHLEDEEFIRALV